jgi:hypothetical protein
LALRTLFGNRRPPRYAGAATIEEESMAAANRGRALTIFAVLFGILAISNALKPLQFGGEQTGFVFFGQRLSGTANTLMGPLFGAYLLAYAYGIWNMRRFALPMSHAYALYVILNLILFSMRNPKPPGTGYVIFGIVYAVVASGVSLAAAILLTQRKTELT